MSKICKRCSVPEDKQEKPGLTCDTCTCFVHLSCLWRPGTPGELAGDVFFEYTCVDCSKDKKEVFTRTRLQWVNVIYLTLHYLNIHWYGIGNRGFFHYKTHVCSFIDRHWHELFEPKFKQKKNWIGTIAGVLSVYNHILFRSGSAALGETGWWRLRHGFSPAAAAHILQEISKDKDKPKGRAKSHMSMDKNLFLERVIELGYKELILDDGDALSPAGIEPAPKKRRVDSDELSAASASTYYDHLDSDSRHEAPDGQHEYSLGLCKDGPFSDESFRGFDFPPVSVVPPSDTSSLHSQQHSLPNYDFNYDSDTGSSTPQQHPGPPSDSADEKHAVRKSEARARRDGRPKVARSNSMFSTQLNSVTMPWLTDKPPEVNKDLVEMTEYGEMQLLKQVEGLIHKVKDVNKKAELRRLRASLALRRLKRHKHLPIFDLDSFMKVLGGYMTEDSKVVNNTERVLDRFQRNYLLANLSGTVTGARASILWGGAAAAARSPYSGATLKPYIRRDTTARPLWLRVTEELMLKANRNNKDFVLPPHASLDYSYVRPHHIAAVNSLLAQHFWPGIDVSESLQYPEYSCVVSYKRLVVGCAFLVPDVGANEAYISFVLTRAEWRGAGIGTFMLYHLLQTCTGKDVTLHVSPTNPAIFLYQKFGFKVEELIQDFYEKYYDIDFKGCRHALFLRLSR